MLTLIITNKMKKTILLILLAMLFVLPILGCESKDDLTMSEPPASSTEGLVPASPVQNGGQFEIN